jgi:hypothetical protein
MLGGARRCEAAEGPNVFVRVNGIRLFVEVFGAAGVRLTVA